MTDRLDAVALPRPAPRRTAGPLDDALLRPRRGALPAARPRQPDRSATYLGIHTDDDELGDGGARRGPRRARRRARPPGRDRGASTRPALSPTGPLRARPRAPQPPPRDLRHRRRCGSGSGGRSPSTRSATACSCCSPATTRRSPSGSTRSPAGSRPSRDYLEERARPGRPCRRSGCWQRHRDRDGRRAAGLLRRDRGRRRRRPRRPPSSAASTRADRRRPRSPSSCTRPGWRGRSPTAPTTGRSAASATTSWSRLRAFDGLDADAILEIGEEQLGRGREAARSRPRARSTRTPTRPTVVDRVKARPPGDVRGGARGLPRRDGPRRAQHLIEHDLVTVPDDERIDVIATPEYLRNVIPFAAYFSPPTFDRDPKGIYIVTPSVGDDPNAMREHNFARSATPASTRRTRATTSSSTSAGATRR